LARFASPERFIIYPSGTPGTPETPVRGKGRLRVGKSLPLPLPSHTPQHYPRGFQNPCPSLIMSHLCLQRPIPNSIHCFINNCPIVVCIVDDVNPVCCQFLCRCFGVVNGCGMNLTAIHRSPHAHVGFCKRVRGFEVDPDVLCRRFDTLLVEDVERDIGSPLVVFVAL
jgi:hypothetical protein